MSEYKGLEKVVSGAQVGVDLAGIRTAKQFGISTGGKMPRGFRTLIGPRPDWAEEYGLTEHDVSSSYPPRTVSNVLHSDGTLVIAYDFKSAGTALTVKKVRLYDRKLYEVQLGPECDLNVEGLDIAAWIQTNEIKVLNVAGNSVARFPDIEDLVSEILSTCFTSLGFRLTTGD